MNANMIPNDDARGMDAADATGHEIEPHFQLSPGGASPTAAAPAERSMGKEARIGLIVVGVLAGALLGLVVKRFWLTSPALMDSPAEHMASQPHALPSNERPTVVTAQKDRPAAAAARPDWAQSQPSDAGSDVPHGSFLPAEEPAANPRYAQQDQPPAAEEAAPPNAEADPFHARFAADAPAQAPAESPTAPEALDVAPEGAAALDARKPTRSPRNPLRRLSAEVPLEETPTDAEADPATSGTEPTIPDPNAAPDPSSAQPPAAAEAPGSDALSFEPANEPQGAADRAALENGFDQSTVDPDAGPAAEAAADSDRMPAAEPQFAQPQIAAPAPRQYPAQTAEAPLPGPAAASRPADGRYTIQPNDSLWTISQKVYGDGRYYQAIAQHNRGRMPHPDRLSAGTVLDVPPVSTLEQNYPTLCPRQRRSALVQSRSVPPAAREAAPVRGEDIYIVAEGDTLFDIARYELGKAARWGEIYALNRDKLGEDFDFLQPGLELCMPPRRSGAAAEVSQQPTDRYQR